MNNEKVRIMAEIAIMSALGIVLDLTSAFIGRFIWAAGGSIGIQMLPVFIIAYRRGLKEGLLTGLIIGSIQVIMPNAYLLNPIQILLDYPIAYGLVGLSGVFTKRIKDNISYGKLKLYILLGVSIGGLLRFMSHTISGVIYFSGLSINNLSLNEILVALWGSLIYNGSYMIPSILLCVLVMVLIPHKQILNIDIKK